MMELFTNVLTVTFITFGPFMVGATIIRLGFNLYKETTSQPKLVYTAVVFIGAAGFIIVGFGIYFSSIYINHYFMHGVFNPFPFSVH